MLTACCVLVMLNLFPKNNLHCGILSFPGVRWFSEYMYIYTGLITYYKCQFYLLYIQWDIFKEQILCEWLLFAFSGFNDAILTKLHMYFEAENLHVAANLWKLQDCFSLRKALLYGTYCSFPMVSKNLYYFLASRTPTLQVVNSHYLHRVGCDGKSKRSWIVNFCIINSW